MSVVARLWPRRRGVPVDTATKVSLVLLTLLGVVMVLPLYWMVIQAFKPLEELLLFPPRWYVRNPTLESFQNLVLAASGTLVPFSRYLFNSILVTTVTVFSAVIISCLCAYPLSKMKFQGAAAVRWLITASLLIAPEVLAIPRYLMIDALGLIDTYGALIVPHLVNSVGVFMMINFIPSIVPDALLESARIDGASEWRIFWKIVMPLSSPAWATLAILTFLSVWNDGGTAAVYTRTESMKVLPTAIASISAEGTLARIGAAAAAALLNAIPGVVIFLWLQRRVMETIAHTGIK